ncbi:MAG: Gfo/Idh/MocA family oxidoreductase [Bacteroidia bacterium]|nr:Gfo/Idh/MocA family oxidoreductase [Bacteroidia bacterium]
MATPIRWGILGPGKIAHKFAQGLQTLPDAVIQAVASRDKARSQEFAAEYGIINAYDSYEALVADPEVDIVYVATPHTFHYDLTMMCIEAGKHVLCEKPMGINARQVQDMICAAREKQVYLMEGLWTYFLPVWKRIREWLDAGLIGDVRLFQADFSFLGTDDLDSRLYNPGLAGGALLDIGIYPIVMSYWLFGRNPIEVASLATLSSTGVDASSAYLFKYDGGEMAVLNSSFQVHGPKEAVINGTKGRIRVPLFWKTEEAFLEIEDEVAEHFRAPHTATGLEYEAAAAMGDLRAGRLESEIFRQADSLRLVSMLDRLRADWGVIYPGE